MVKRFTGRAPLKDLCSWTGLPRSNFYYKPSDGKQGFAPSTTTFRKDGTEVSNAVIIEEIKGILSQEFVCYGYQKTAKALKELDYVINHKKVYRLMDQSNLLLGKLIKTSGKRQWVQHRKIKAEKPMEHLCLDIKYLWVAGERRHYFLLTIIDVYSRKALQWIFQKSIRKMDVINLFRTLNQAHSIKGVNIRNDNGSQFIANDVKAFLRAAEANQEFTHIATPEENSYIEAYHSILDTEVVQRYEFASYYDAKVTLTAYVDFYNNRRLHGGIGYKTPQKMWDEYQNNIFTVSGEAEVGSAEEQPIRNSLASEERPEGADQNVPSATSLSLLKYASENLPKTLNSFKESVQTIGV